MSWKAPNGNDAVAEAGLEQAQARVDEAQRRLEDVRNLPEPEVVAQAEGSVGSGRGSASGDPKVRLRR